MFSLIYINKTKLYMIIEIDYTLQILHFTAKNNQEKDLSMKKWIIIYVYLNTGIVQA